nr:MAG TPA: hypothetical protein [Caudoviricetes sp.]
MNFFRVRKRFVFPINLCHYVLKCFYLLIYSLCLCKLIKSII